MRFPEFAAWAKKLAPELHYWNGTGVNGHLNTYLGLKPVGIGRAREYTAEHQRRYHAYVVMNRTLGKKDGEHDPHYLTKQVCDMAGQHVTGWIVIGQGKVRWCADAITALEDLPFDLERGVTVFKIWEGDR